MREILREAHALTADVGGSAAADFAAILSTVLPVVGLLPGMEGPPVDRLLLLTELADVVRIAALGVPGSADSRFA